MSTPIHRIVENCRNGTEPALIMRMRSGWAVMGAQQVLRGYSLLLPDPVVPHLNALLPADRDLFMADLGRLGEAVLSVTRALRINYAIFGNLAPALHAHVHPRFIDEPEALRTANPWGYDWTLAPRFDVAEHGLLRDAIRTAMLDALVVAPGVVTPGVVTPGAAAPHGVPHHVDVTVADMARSTHFYDLCLPLFGYERIADCADGPLWRCAHFEFGLQLARGENTSRVHDRHSPGVHHIAFRADSVAAVRRAHDTLHAAGVNILDAPAAYEHYAPGYFAMFFADPDGIKLEFVYTPHERACLQTGSGM